MRPASLATVVGMCIYCTADPSDVSLYTNAAHVVAEGVMRNDITLAPGLQCDRCNQYFGQHLEPELIRHPAVAWAIQSAGVPGKRGKVRSRVANVVRTVVPTSGFYVETAPPVIRKNGAGQTVVTVLPLLDPNFDLLRFRRALHLVALNTLAYAAGGAEARKHKYDLVRAYVRKPTRHEAWPFAFSCDGQGHDVDVVVYSPEDSGLVVRVGLYTHHFYVDLLNTGNLAEWVTTQVSMKAELVGPGDDHPKSPTAGSVPGEKRYRLRVEDAKSSGDGNGLGRRAS